MNPTDSLRELFDQHEALRVMMDNCEQLADDIDRGRGDLGKLTREVAKLRGAFEAHNRFEEQVGVGHPPLDHIDEHRALARGLDGPTAELRATLYLLRGHLAGEERHFRTL